jgi:hypothetical protein
MRVKPGNKKCFYVLIRRLRRKGRGKGHYHQVVDSLCFQQGGFFRQRIDQGHGMVTGQYLTGMGMKSDQYGLTPDGQGFFFQLVNDLPVTQVHPVKRTYCDHRLPERG